MNWLPKTVHSGKRGAALIIVLAFVVLLTGVAVAYLSRATSDRQVAHSSFNQSNVDQLAQSAMDNIIGDLQQEIVNGSTAITQADGTTVYTPTSAVYMVPQRSGANAAGVPNLIRRSVRSEPALWPDPNVGPALGSRASAVNSTNLADVSANGRYITPARWNTHYLVPKKNTGPGQDDSIPIDAFANATPDWVFVTSSGATPSPAPATVIGRYSYAVYDEGGLLDMNVAGYPTGTTTLQSGRKGSVAFADLTALGNYPIPNGPPPPGTAYQVDKIVGWRNCASAQPDGDFPNFTFTAAQASNYVNSVLSNTNGFMRVAPNVWVSGSGGSNAAKRTDQSFVQRQELIAFRKTTQFSANALQYLSMFSREINSPSFSPSTPTGSNIDYAALATTSTAINPNFLLRRVTTNFTRFDGTTAVVGEPLVKTRFPLTRLGWITYKGPSASRILPPQTPALLPTDPNYDMWALQWLYGIPASYLQLGTVVNVKACFGLTFGGAVGNPTYPWIYTNPTGAGPASAIMRLDEVADAGREPDFFELLQAGILSGSVGQNTAPPPGISGQGTTGGNVFPDVHMSSSVQHLLSIGAAIIDQADPDSIPTRIQFTGTNGNTWTAYSVENLPYITQIYPIAGTSPNTPTQWATYLLFQLWNPHQNASALPNNVRLRVDGAIGLFRGGNGQSWTLGNPPQIIANGSNDGQSVTLNSAFSFSAPFPLTATNTANAAPAPGPLAGGAFAVLPATP